jgi:lipoprotein-anchoring transpeptidase ErfK/SrfK
MILLAVLGLAVSIGLGVRCWRAEREAEKPAEMPLPPPMPSLSVSPQEEIDRATAASVSAAAAAPQPATTAAPPPPAAATGSPVGPDPALALWAEAKDGMDRGEWGGARAKAYAALATVQLPALRRTIETALGDINLRLATTPAPMEEKVDYVVKEGDHLGALARKYGTTVELLAKSNQLSGKTIRPGDRLRVLTGIFRVTVDLSDHELTLCLNDRFFKRYSVGTGKYEKTPTGEFKITDRIPQPTWWRSDGQPIPYGHKDNLLGTHWLALDVRGYGIHGTWEPDTIGKSESAGCVRLRNEDIEELFTLLPVGVKVTIQP